MKDTKKFVTGGFWISNLKWLFGGLAIGLLLSLFFSALRGEFLNLQNVLGNIIFSIMISICINSTIRLAQYLIKLCNLNYWQFIILYYGSSLTGTFAGVELSLYLLSIIDGYHYVFISSPKTLISSLAISVVVCTVVYAYYEQRSRLGARLKESELDVAKLNQLKTQAELQALQSKINPHFLYNALNSIAGLIHEDADKAEDMTLKLSKLFRYSMNSQHENFASIADELEVVKTYFDIEVVRFGNRINFEIQAEAGLEKEQIPRFIIQPLVENALKHGLHNVTQNGKLSVSVFSLENRIAIEVYDNGVPFPDELSAGYGLQSTYDKLKLLYQDNYEVQLINKPKKVVRILVPRL